ncbi:MAG: SprT family zinc-dependent metalloprotease [Bacteroidota bacterium]
MFFRKEQQLSINSMILVHGMKIHIMRKPIKHSYLRLKEKDGSIHVSIPLTKTDAQIRMFVSQHIVWIQKQLKKINRKSFAERMILQALPALVHWLGKAYEVKTTYSQTDFSIKPDQNNILNIKMPPDTSAELLNVAWDRFCEDTVRTIIQKLIPRWEKKIGVQVKKIMYKKMSTCWGSCTPASQRISINTKLAQHNPGCIEYVLVHELVHFLEASHNRRFHSLMSQYLPSWEKWKKLLKDRYATF